MSTSYNSCGVGSDRKSLAPPVEPLWPFVTCFQLVYSLVNTSMALYVVPIEAQRFYGSNASLWVGIYSAVCGFTQVICPVAGKFSDRHSSAYGRRRPFIVFGIALAVLAFLVMMVASTQLWPGVYLFGLFLGQIALNIAYAAFCGLPADLGGIKAVSDKVGAIDEHDEDTKSTVSGYMALHCFLGALVAMIVIVFTRTCAVQVQYPIFMVSLIVACFVVCMSASEAPTNLFSDVNEVHLGFEDLVACFTIDMSKDSDFFWVCASRAFFYCSISSSVFMYYYMHDMILVGRSDAAVWYHVAVLVIAAQIVGAIFSMPCGRLSNRIGRKVVIYGANVLISITFTLYTIAPKLGNFAWPVVLAAGIIYGIGTATYMSVDYALALDCLPAGKTTAEAFGLWGVAGFLGTTIGPLMGGVLLWLPTQGKWPSVSASRHSSDEYPYIGYAMMLLATGPVMNIIGAVCVAQIRGLKEDAPHEALEDTPHEASA